MRWPWISRDHHAEVVAGKNEVIHTLQRTIAALEAALKTPAPIEVTAHVQMPEPAIPQLIRRAPRPVAEEKREPKPIDWAKVDTGDAAQMAKLAIDEFGGIPQPHVLARWQQQVTALARAAKMKELRNAATRGETGTITAPIPVTEEEARQQGPDYVPAHVRELVEAAERSA